MEPAASYESELLCIWALAGVLSHRPCHRNYECEDCELFKALAGRTSGELVNQTVAADDGQPGSGRRVEDQVRAHLSHIILGCTLHLDRYYSPNHSWLVQEDGNMVALGLDGAILRILHPIDEIVTPRVGLRLKRGEPCGWITRRRLAIPLALPISGEVKDVNTGYLEAMLGRGRIDDSEDWLLRLAALEPLDSTSGLYRGEDLLVWYLKQIRILKRHLEGSITSGAHQDLGITLPDGGGRVDDLEHVLGRERYEKLIEEIF